MPVTIRDVSALAGVSMSTVSHVINNTRPVSEAARQRVLAAIRETGYTPNSVARSLKTAATRTIGLVVGDIANPYYTAVAHALETRARAAGYSVVLSDSDDDPRHEAEMLRVLAERRVDGLVLAASSYSEAGALDYLRQRAIPVVQIDRIIDENYDYVVAQNKAATHELVTHLCALGHRDIAMLAGLPGLSTSRERVAGFHEALRDSGIDPDPGLIQLGGSRIEPARIATLALLDQEPRPTAIVAGNNQMALGAMKALRERGVRVPQDVALVAFDDFEWADLFQPRLTTIAQPCEGIGQHAVELLLDRIHDPDLPARHVRLPAMMRHRESCGCPPEPLPGQKNAVSVPAFPESGD